MRRTAERQEGDGRGGRQGWFLFSYAGKSTEQVSGTWVAGVKTVEYRS